MYFFSFRKLDFFALQKNNRYGHRFSCDLLCLLTLWVPLGFSSFMPTVQTLVCWSAHGCWPFSSGAAMNWDFSWVKALLSLRHGIGSNTLKTWKREKWGWAKQLYCDVATLCNESTISELLQPNTFNILRQTHLKFLTCISEFFFLFVWPRLVWICSHGETAVPEKPSLATVSKTRPRRGHMSKLLVHSICRLSFWQ